LRTGCDTEVLQSVKPNAILRPGQHFYERADPSSTKWTKIYTNLIFKAVHANGLERTAAASNSTEMPRLAEPTYADGDTLQIDDILDTTVAFMIAGLVVLTIVSIWRKSFVKRTLRWTLSSSQLEVEKPYVIPNNVVLASGMFVENWRVIDI
jgi:hypothetical protein